MSGKLCWAFSVALVALVGYHFYSNASAVQPTPAERPVYKVADPNANRITQVRYTAWYPDDEPEKPAEEKPITPPPPSIPAPLPPLPELPPPAPAVEKKEEPKVPPQLLEKVKELAPALFPVPSPGVAIPVPIPEIPPVPAPEKKETLPIPEPKVQAEPFKLPQEPKKPEVPVPTFPTPAPAPTPVPAPTPLEPEPPLPVPVPPQTPLPQPTLPVPQPAPKEVTPPPLPDFPQPQLPAPQFQQTQPVPELSIQPYPKPFPPEPQPQPQPQAQTPPAQPRPLLVPLRPLTGAGSPEPLEPITRTQATDPSPKPAIDKKFLVDYVCKQGEIDFADVSRAVYKTGKLARALERFQRDMIQEKVGGALPPFSLGTAVPCPPKIILDKWYGDLVLEAEPERRPTPPESDNSTSIAGLAQQIIQSLSEPKTSPANVENSREFEFPAKVAQSPTKPLTSKWTFFLEIIDGRNIVTARLNKVIQFRVDCDTVDMQAPRGAVLAAGHVRITSNALECHSDKVAIQFAEDQILIEGRAFLKCQREGQEMELRSDRFSLKLSEIAGEPAPTTSARPPVVRTGRAQD